MAEETQTPPSQGRRRRSRVPLLWFLGLTALNGLFWFSADFGSFAPPSEGTFVERLLMFEVTEAGPFASLFIGTGEGYYIVMAVMGVVLLTLAFLIALIPKNWGAIIAACIGIAVWFFCGFVVAGLRIT
jgi:O-antigen/teichoic acid export membrane protein